MFFKIYFSRRKFEQDAAALVQKQNGWAAGLIVVQEFFLLHLMSNT